MLDQLNSLRRWDEAPSLLRRVARRIASALKLPSGGNQGSRYDASAMRALKIARYSLVLMDADGQVVWTREYDSGGVFEFGPRQRLWVFCGFTNHTGCETEISEYEIELMGEDGLVVERFGDSFGDSVIIPPGESKQFPAEWRM